MWLIPPDSRGGVILTRFRLPLLFILLALVLCHPPVGAGQSWSQGDSVPAVTRFHKVEPQLLKQAFASDGPLRFVVYLREQADVRLSLSELDPLARRRGVVQALQFVARRDQSSIQTYLSARQAAGRVRDFTPYWIFNGLAVLADGKTILELALRPDVEIIRLDHRRHLVAGELRAGDHELPSGGVAWNIQRIGAQWVWDALGIDGEGVVVANMDTGVDWGHPSLHSRYRGYDPKGFHQHRGNWFCATDEDYLYPGDGHGHGTHTMGLMVGREEGVGIGVAPGAQWIAVKVFDNQGYTYDSWIHSGFQWLLAPEGDVALAPQVVNSSWGSDVGSDTTFGADIQALRAAGILTVFSAGNNGPGRGTIGSPASLGQTLAVGATDATDVVASFSGRGPSPWGKTKPDLVAPGVDVRSSAPGGAYAYYHGTSAAAPQVAGVAALLLQARPSLTVTETEGMLIDSARPLGEPIPNNDYGWGLVDARGAVVSAVDAATVLGTVRRALDGSPLAGATVRSTALVGERSAEVTTDAQGYYELVMAAGTYTLTASAFGYYPQVTSRLTLTRGQELVRGFALNLKPTGVMVGRVTEAGTGLPISATLEVVNTPVQTQSDSQTGLYTLALPAGTYTISVKAPGYRVGRMQAVTIIAEEDVECDFTLRPSPTILLVDSGSWYYGSEIAYFTEALDDLDYLYDLWSIRRPFDDVADIPSMDDLTRYDIVIWSAPQDSPGYVGADEAVAGFLEAGGLLLLTGQDIGYWDGGGAMTYAPYFQQYLQARYVRDDSGIQAVEGEDGLFSGLSFRIQGGDGAGNQLYPDEVKVLGHDHAASAFYYVGNGSAGQWVGLCRPYRTLYLAFGFEAIDSRGARQEVMDRALEWLAGPRAVVGVELQVTSREPQVATTDRSAIHRLRLRNTGDGGEGSAYQVSLGPFTWPITLMLSTLDQVSVQQQSLTLSLARCHSATLAVEVAIPAGTERDITRQVTLTARVPWEGQASDELQQRAHAAGPSETVTLTTKTPAPVLLVDDDRWYNQEARYQAAMERAGIAYDNWTVGWGGQLADGSISASALTMYPLVVWFTGYDWYETLTTEEEVRLGEYLSQGGRLLLSSQDYLYTQGLSPLGVEYLGVLTYTEGLSTAVAYGVEGSPIGDSMIGPYELIYPFPNWSDALTPTQAAKPAVLGGHGHPIAVTRKGESGSVCTKSAFFAFPLEALARDAMAEVMCQAVGWLSWLGDSSLAVDKPLAQDGERLMYIALLENDGLAGVTAGFEGRVPTYTTYVPGSASSGAVHDGGFVRWEGRLEPRSAITIAYEVEIGSGLPRGTWVSNVSRVGYADGKLSFARWAHSRVNAPDLSPSFIAAELPQISSGEMLTYRVSVRNEGMADAPATGLTVTIPTELKVISSSLTTDGGVPASLRGRQILWRGPVTVDHSVIMTYHVVATRTLVDLRAVTPIEVNDGLGVSLRRESAVTISPYRHHLLLIWKRWSPQWLSE